MSATSVGRVKTTWKYPTGSRSTSSAARTASGGGSRLIAGYTAQLVERTDHRPHRPRGDPGVERGRVKPAVAEHGLDHADIDAVFQQMGGKAVAQRMGADPLGDL